MGESSTKAPAAKPAYRRTGVTGPDTGPADEHPLGLQHLAGNAAVAELITGAQARLSVGAVGDPYEREADEVADEVVRSVRSGAVGAPPDPSSRVARRMQRRPAAAAAGEHDLDAPLDRSIAAARGGGRPLPDDALQTLQPAFGADFGEVRLHEGSEASRLNDAVGAEAFTVGSDIFFRDRVPDATDPLLSHELTHVVQQGAATTDEAAAPDIARRSPAVQRLVPGQHAPMEDSDPADDVIENLELGGEAFEVFQEFDDEDFAKDAKVSDGTADNLSYASGAGDVAGMFIGLASSIRAFKKEDAKGADKAAAVLDGADALVGGAGGIASIVDTAKDGAGGSKEVAGSLAGFGEIFNGIKETFKLVRKIVELANETDAKKAKTGQEKFHDAMEIITGMLEVAKSGVSAAKEFLTAFTSGPSAALSNSVPGFAIALGAADMIVRSVDLVTAMVQANVMRTEKQKFKTLLGGKKGASSKKEAEAIVKKLDAKKDRAEELTDEEAAQYEAANGYLFSKGLQYINDKRRDRAILKMAVAMGKVAGDVATLGGASAPVGVGLKAGAMALDVGASVFRKFKQWGRDKKAAKEDKGEVVTGFFSIFDSDKSTKKKWLMYNQMVDKIFAMVVAADAIAKPDPDTRFKGVNKYVLAMGMAPKKMFALRDDPAKLRTEMIEALKKRE